MFLGGVGGYERSVSGVQPFGQGCSDGEAGFKVLHGPVGLGLIISIPTLASVIGLRVLHGPVGLGLLISVSTLV